MPTIDQRIRFAEKYIVTKEGRQYDLTGRQWVVDELLRPTFGWKRWPANATTTCTKCKDNIGQIVDWSPELAVTQCVEKSVECTGLALHPIMLVVLNLPRRQGKTLNCAALALGELYLSNNKSITLMASAGKQTKRLFEENYGAIINNNKELRAGSEMTLNSIYVPKRKSRFTFVDTSHKSITGTGRTLIIIDEARDVDARTAAALIPSMRDQNGVECTRGHVHGPRTTETKECPVCGDPLVPWFGRLLIISSSGVLEGNEKDWFAELVTTLDENPHPNVHLYRSETVTNPSVAEESTRMIEEVFGANSAMRTYIDVEMSNTSRLKGEDFVSTVDARACVSRKLFQQEGMSGRCVGFLDTSLVNDATSLVIVGEDTEASGYPWEHVAVWRIDVWDPKRQAGGSIDPTEIQKHLDRYIPQFPGLIDLHVDVRGMTWAVDLVRYNNTQRRGWGAKLKAFHGQQKERDVAWNQLEQRILHRKIKYPDHPQLLAELKGVRRFTRGDGSVEIRDRSRRVRHADIVESLAACCWRVWVEQSRPKQTLGQANNPSRAAKELLDRLYRPTTGGLKGGTDNF